MRVQISKLPERLQKGVSAIADFGYFEVGESGITLHAEKGTALRIQRKQKEITITYDTEPHFYVALARSLGLGEGTHEIVPQLEKLGLMLDCSRNAVPKPEHLKRLLCMLALAGYNYLELYTEDTYELEGEPYFGYMRGRYKVEELREIFDFANLLGIEMIPCIQTLAHLRALTNWIMYAEHIDIDDILMVDDERTYKLIRKMLSFWVDNFNARRINIGMDEAFHLGRGRYTDQFGYVSIDELYLKHAKKVFEICDELGIEVEFWADGFANTTLSVEQVQALFNGNQIPIYWCYDPVGQEFHEKRMRQFQEYAGKVIYGGGIWNFIGFAPNNSESMQTMDEEFAAARVCGVDNILITTWGTDGAECSIYATIPALWHATELAYPTEADMEEVIRCLTGYTKSEWNFCEKINSTTPDIARKSNAAKYMLYNDFLIGLLDENTRANAGEIFEAYLPIYAELANRDSQFSYVFCSLAKLCHLLMQKATFGKRLYADYHGKDKRELAPYIEELTEIIERMEVFYQAFRTQWMKENKSFGFEITGDVRIGGMIHRAKSVQQTLRAYMDGDISKIYELEEKRLNYFGGQIEGEERFAPVHNVWTTLYSVNIHKDY